VIERDFLGSARQVSMMADDRPRWRIRISTIMLLIIIVALAVTLFSERRRREVEVERLRALAEQSLADAQLARAAAALQAVNQRAGIKKGSQQTGAGSQRVESNLGDRKSAEKRP
jgi:hypothetical protein